MTSNFSQLSGNSFSVKINTQQKIKVQTVSGGVKVPAKFKDLEDFNPTNLQDKYLIMYDAATQKYIPVDPDVVLNNAIETNGGLPQEFVNQLDTDLDNKINLDAGTF